jgi:hypothetical protein
VAQTFKAGVDLLNHIPVTDHSQKVPLQLLLTVAADVVQLSCSHSLMVEPSTNHVPNVIFLQNESVEMPVKLSNEQFVSLFRLVLLISESL